MRPCYWIHDLNPPWSQAHRHPVRSARRASSIKGGGSSSIVVLAQYTWHLAVAVQRGNLRLPDVVLARTRGHRRSSSRTHGSIYQSWQRSRHDGTLMCEPTITRARKLTRTRVSDPETSVVVLLVTVTVTVSPCAAMGVGKMGETSQVEQPVRNCARTYACMHTRRPALLHTGGVRRSRVHL